MFNTSILGYAYYTGLDKERISNLNLLLFLFFRLYIVFTSSLHKVSSGTHRKKEPLSQNGSAEGSFSGVCSFLYILDMTVISRCVFEEIMYKKYTFYIYARPVKYSLCEKIFYYLLTVIFWCFIIMNPKTLYSKMFSVICNFFMFNLVPYPCLSCDSPLTELIYSFLLSIYSLMN